MKRTIITLPILLLSGSIAYAEPTSVEIDNAERQAKKYRIGYSADMAYVIPFRDGEYVYAIERNAGMLEQTKFSRHKISVKPTPPSSDPSSPPDQLWDMRLDNNMEGRDYDRRILIAGPLKKAPVSATGKSCSLPEVPRGEVFKPNGFQADSDLLKKHNGGKLPSVVCEYRFAGRKVTIEMRAVEAVPVGDMSVSYRSKIVVRSGEYFYEINRHNPYDIFWVGDINGDGKIDIIGTEDTTHASGATETKELLISDDPNSKADRLKLNIEGTHQVPGC